MKFAKRPMWVKQALLRPFVHSGLARSDQVLMTFDDGPHPIHTAEVISQLRDANTTALFFLIGSRIASNPGLTELITEAGHRIGNHSYSHTRLGWLDRSLAWEEIARCQKLLPSGSEWFRPPFGSLTPGLWHAARRHGLGIVNWTLDSNDWQCKSASDAEQCASEVLDQVRAGDTILFHDTHPYIKAILDRVLAGLTRKQLLIN